jgi:hypothetical protein
MMAMEEYIASTISSNAKVSANDWGDLFMNSHQLMISQAPHSFF